MEKVYNIKVTKYNEGFEEVEDAIIVEAPFTIFLDNQELITLLCSPDNIEYLILGFLHSEGFISSLEDIKAINIDDEKAIAYVSTRESSFIAKALYGKRTITSGCGKGTTFYNVIDSIKTKKNEKVVYFNPDEIFSLVKKVYDMSLLFKQTGGVHGCGLCDCEKVLVFHEDIGRHNALDKVFGQALKEGIPLEDKIIITTGRISSEMLIKCAKRKIPVIASRSASTNLAINLAKELGITLLGFIRGKRMNIYSEEWRIELHKK